MGQWGSLLVGGVQWESVRKEREQIYIDGPKERKKLVHRKLKSFLDTHKNPSFWVKRLRKTETFAYV